MRKIYILDGDRLFSECLKIYLQGRFFVRYFPNPFEIMTGIEEEIPDLIISEANLPGASVFSLLNELISYPDTAIIPIIILSDTKFPERDLKDYNIKVILKKEKLKPEEIVYYAERYTR